MESQPPVADNHMVSLVLKRACLRLIVRTISAIQILIFMGVRITNIGLFKWAFLQSVWHWVEHVYLGVWTFSLYRIFEILMYTKIQFSGARCSSNFVTVCGPRPTISTWRSPADLSNPMRHQAQARYRAAIPPSSRIISWHISQTNLLESRSLVINGLGFYIA